VGYSTSITIGTDGLPVISYLNNTNYVLKVVKCGNVSCSSSNTITTVDSVGDEGRYTSITIGTDGLPVISYYDITNGDLKVVKCGNPFCSSGNTNTKVDSAGNVGYYSSITIGTDGLPVISNFSFHLDYTNGDLKVVKCANPFCLNNWSRR
jgi:restriction endonuclease S subunit